MDITCLDYCMTDEQREHFDQQGFLIVEDALDSGMLERLLNAGDRVDAREREIQGLGAGQIMNKFRSIVEDAAFLDLLDQPKTFPLIWDILGWNVQHYISHLVYYPPEHPDRSNSKTGGWHQDGGRPVPEMERPHPRLSLKVAFWLTDTSAPDRGGIRIVPGSHKRDIPPERWPDGENGSPGASGFEDMMQVRVKAGTAVLFDRRLWHSRGFNTSDITRKVLFLGYSYRWLRGLDYNLIPDEILEACDPIRRQLLGDGVDVKGWWQPTDADVPLKGWLLEHKGESYVEKIGQKQWEREKWAAVS
ncbi:MAG: phytanoyl-CoA dioxygenase family protein [Gemmatimonadota bacterium]|nr:phytanoyl-CoA dioxygenase family protein [Gemmatimonadota bacterium]